jgi:hypothetical protein
MRFFIKKSKDEKNHLFSLTYLQFLMGRFIIVLFLIGRIRSSPGGGGLPSRKYN